MMTEGDLEEAQMEMLTSAKSNNKGLGDIAFAFDIVSSNIFKPYQATHVYAGNTQDGVIKTVSTSFIS